VFGLTYTSKDRRREVVTSTCRVYHKSGLNMRLFQLDS
jgi:hypothetical protein